MITAKYKLERKSDMKLIIAKKVTWNSDTNCFIFYDELSHTFFNVNPFHIEFESNEDH